MSNQVKPVRSRRLYEEVAERLSEAIAQGRYPVGSRLPAERELAMIFNVGRPTIREALIALETSGQVDVRTGSGVYVLAQHVGADASFELDIGPFELVEARLLIEGESAALAAELGSDEQHAAIREAFRSMEAEDADPAGGEAADRSFHLAIARATQNSALRYVVDQLWAMRDRSQLARRVQDRLRLRGVRPRLEEHRAVCDAIVARDANAARSAMRAHLRRVLVDLLEATEVDEVEAARARIQRQRERFERSVGATEEKP
jgi:DNA-binding FadR family transcriptional regulator